MQSMINPYQEFSNQQWMYPNLDDTHWEEMDPEEELEKMQATSGGQLLNSEWSDWGLHEVTAPEATFTDTDIQ